MLGLSKLQSVNEKRKKSFVQERPRREEDSDVDYEENKEQEWEIPMDEVVNSSQINEKKADSNAFYQPMKPMDPIQLSQAVKQTRPVSVFPNVKETKEETGARRTAGYSKDETSTRRVSDYTKEEPVTRHMTEYSLDEPTMRRMAEASKEEVGMRQTREYPKDEIGARRTTEYPRITPSKYYDDMEKNSTPANNDDNISHSPDGEDYDDLMKQIEEFRSKATQLQEIMDIKTKKAQQLQAQIDQRQAQMNEFSKKLEVQMDHMMDQLGNQMQYMEDTMISDMVENYNQITAKLMADFQQIIDNVNASDQLTQEKVDQMKIEVLGKMHSEIVDVCKNSDSLAKGLDNQMDGLAKHYIVKRSNKLTIVVLALTILNTAGIVAMFLFLTGVWSIF